MAFIHNILVGFVAGIATVLLKLFVFDFVFDNALLEWGASALTAGVVVGVLWGTVFGRG